MASPRVRGAGRSKQRARVDRRSKRSIRSPRTAHKPSRCSGASQRHCNRSPRSLSAAAEEGGGPVRSDHDRRHKNYSTATGSAHSGCVRRLRRFRRGLEGRRPHHSRWQLVSVEGCAGGAACLCRPYLTVDGAALWRPDRSHRGESNHHDSAYEQAACPDRCAAPLWSDHDCVSAHRTDHDI